MRPYHRYLKQPSRKLPASSRLMRNSICGGDYGANKSLGVQFYRQRPIGPYIVDFYAPAANLVIEVDGSQHIEPEHRRQDAARDSYLQAGELCVLRFDNRQALTETEAVVEMIWRVMLESKRSATE